METLFCAIVSLAGALYGGSNPIGKPYPPDLLLLYLCTGLVSVGLGIRGFIIIADNGRYVTGTLLFMGGLLLWNSHLGPGAIMAAIYPDGIPLLFIPHFP